MISNIHEGISSQRKHESQFDWMQSHPEVEGSDKIGLTKKNLTSIK